jgi:hypothetical protein
MMSFNRQTAQRIAAVRAGWNDAAWGPAGRAIEPAWASWYAQGVRGGAVFRQQRASALQPASPGKR